MVAWLLLAASFTFPSCAGHGLPFSAVHVSMNIRNWNILCWNIRGLNATDKHDAVRNKIEESGCSIVCLQETKIQHFDMPLIKKIAPRRFDKLDFVPSVGASGESWFFGIVLCSLALLLINNCLG